MLPYRAASSLLRTLMMVPLIAVLVLLFDYGLTRAVFEIFFLGR